MAKIWQFNQTSADVPYLCLFGRKLPVFCGQGIKAEHAYSQHYAERVGFEKIMRPHKDCRKKRDCHVQVHILASTDVAIDIPDSVRFRRVSTSIITLLGVIASQQANPYSLLALKPSSSSAIP
jgi:hypothetical protein